MKYCIGIEDLAANALIESMRRENNRFVTYESIENYGMKVQQFLSEQGEKLVLVLSRESKNEFIRNYSDFFEEKEENGELGIEVRKEKSLDELVDEFRGYLAFDLLMALIDESSVEALLREAR